MKNFKLVKTTAALALGASVVTAAVVPGATDASAASKYKVSNGKLVNAKTGKVVKGYVVFKSKLYYNGKLKKGYKTVGSGKTIKLYYNGSLKKGYKTAKNNKLLFFNGSLKKGYKTAGNGERLYKDGQLDKGYEVYGDVDKDPSLYYNGYLKSGYKTANNATLLFYNGKLKEGYKTASNDTRLYKDGRQNEGQYLVEDKDLLFEGFNLAKGLVKADANKKFYNDGKLATGEFEYEGKKITLKDGVEVNLNIESVSAINTKSLEVKFNQAADVKDTDFSVAKGSVKANIAKVTLSEDKKSATIELTSKLTKGEYTVSVKAGEQTLTSTVTAEDEKVDKVEVLSNKAVSLTSKTATVAYKVFNQYGEDITSATPASDLSLTLSNGTATPDPTRGLVTLTTTADYKIGDTATLSILHKSTSKFASQVVTFSDAATTAEVAIKGLYNTDDSSAKLTADTDSADFSNFVLLLDAKDQYGKDVDSSDVYGGVIVTSSDESVVKVATTTKQVTLADGTKSTAIELVAPTTVKAGSATITVVSKTTGKVASYKVTVGEGVKADSISLSAPTKTTAAGEGFELPFTVTGVDGSEITNASVLSTVGKGVTITTNDTNVTGAFVKDAKTGKAKLVFADTNALATADRTVQVFATTANGKTASATVTIKAAAKGSVIESTKDVVTNLAVDGDVTLSDANVVVKDQYGRDFDYVTAGYTVEVTKKDNKADKVSLSGTSNTTIDATNTVTLTGDKKGSETLVLTLKDSNGVKVASSELELNVKVVDYAEIASYELANIPTVYDDGAASTHAEALTVYGVTSNGTKVVVPASKYTVTTDNAALTYSNGKLDANNVVQADGKDVTVNVKVIVDGNDGAVTLDKAVTVSKPALKAASLELKSTNDLAIEDGVVVAKATDLTVATLQGLLNAKDQFGKEYTNGTATLTLTGYKDAKGAAKVVANNGTVNPTLDVKAGDTFTVTYVLDGIAKSVKVIAE